MYYVCFTNYLFDFNIYIYTTSFCQYIYIYIHIYICIYLQSFLFFVKLDMLFSCCMIFFTHTHMYIYYIHMYSVIEGSLEFKLPTICAEVETLKKCMPS